MSQNITILIIIN